MEELNTRLEEQVDWSKALIFDGTGKIHGKLKCSAGEAEIKEIIKVISTKESAFSSDFKVESDIFQVQSYHPALVYGRKQDESRSEGFSLVRGKDSNGDVVYLLVIFAKPFVSSYIINQQIDFYDSNVGMLDDFTK